MDKISVYAFYDKKAEKYDVPFFAGSDIFAKRKFIMMVQEKDNMLHKFRSDFELHRIGKFDVLQGELEMDKAILLEGKQVQMEVEE